MTNKIQVSHPVEVGVFGRFRYGGKELVELWNVIEDLAYEVGTDGAAARTHVWAVGMITTRDVLHWAIQKNLLTSQEIEMIQKAL